MPNKKFNAGETFNANEELNAHAESNGDIELYCIPADYDPANYDLTSDDEEKASRSCTIERVFCLPVGSCDQERAGCAADGVNSKSVGRNAALFGGLMFAISHLSTLLISIMDIKVLDGAVEQLNSLMAQAVNDTLILTAGQLGEVKEDLGRAGSTEVGAIVLNGISLVGVGLMAFGVWQCTKKPAHEHAAQHRPNETTPLNRRT